jgi:hypothetical protein
VLKVGSARGATAAGAGAGSVPDFGQVTEHDSGIVAPGFVAMVAVCGGERADLDEQVLVPGGEPPGSVSAGRSRVIGTGKGEAGWAGTAGFSASDGPGAAVSHGVPVLVGDRDAPGGPGVAGRRGGQVPGQVRVARGGTRDEIRSFGERSGRRTITAPISLTRCGAAASGVAWPGPPTQPSSG